MTDKEIKWYVVAKLGCSFGRSRVTTDKFLHNKLKEKLNTNNIEEIVKYLQGLGFTILGKRIRGDSIFTNYHHDIKKEKKMSKAQMEYERTKNGISKPCFRETACRVTM